MKKTHGKIIQPYIKDFKIQKNVFFCLERQIK